MDFNWTLREALTMFERLTDRARRVVVLAQEEARDLEHNYISTVHLLLALIREEDGVAAKVLVANGMSLMACRKKVAVRMPAVKDSPFGHIPFTPRAKKTLELSLRESVQIGSTSIDTEHLLLGLLRACREDSLANANLIMLSMKVDPTDVYDYLVLTLSGYGASRLVPQEDIPVELILLRGRNGPTSIEYRLALADFLEAYAERLRTEIMA